LPEIAEVVNTTEVGTLLLEAEGPPPDAEALVHDLDGCFADSPTGFSDQAGELAFVGMDTFEATF
jgi:hypothetical protein